MKIAFVFLIPIGFILYNCYKLQKQFSWINNIIGILLAVLFIQGSIYFLNHEQTLNKEAIELVR